MVLKGHAFSPDGKHVVMVTEDKTIIIIDVVTGEKMLELETEWGCSYASLSPDGKQLVYSNGSYVGVVDFETGYEKFLEPDCLGDFVAFSPDGRHIASAYDRFIMIRTVETKQAITKIREIDDNYIGINDISFDPSGRRIVSTGSLTYDTIRIRDVETGLELLKLGEGTTVRFSPDGQRLVSTSYNEDTARLWDIKTKKEVKSFYGAYSAVFSPDGKNIAADYHDNSIAIWDAETGDEPLKVLNGHDDKINSISYSPDGQYIASASNDSTIRIWNVETGKEQIAIKGHTNKVNSVAFSPDGKSIVSASDDNSIRVWNALIGEEVWKQQGSYVVKSASYSPNGQYIITDAFNTDIRNATTGIIIMTLKGQEKPTFSLDGKLIATAGSGFDGTITIWELPNIQELIDQTRERFKDRPLTPEERRKYYLE